MMVTKGVLRSWAIDWKYMFLKRSPCLCFSKSLTLVTSETVTRAKLEEIPLKIVELMSIFFLLSNILNDNPSISFELV